MAHLKINDNDHKKITARLKESHKNENGNIQTFLTHGARYSVIVNTYSNLKMEAAIHQYSLEPGASMILRSSLSEYGLLVDHRAIVEAEVQRPDGTKFTLKLDEIEAGTFEKSFIAQIPGTYFCRFIARGASLRGTEFTREKTLTGATFRGGDIPFTGITGSEPVPSGIDKLIEKCCKNITRILIGIFILLLIVVLLHLRS